MNRFFKIVTLAVAAGIMPAAAATLGNEARTPDNRVVYEVFVRNFSSNSKLASVTDQLPRLKELGVDVVWLMPIQPGGNQNRWGTYASPYAIRNYTAIDPLYGFKADVKNLVSTAHSMGMEVWLDWVANHTATDHVWTTSHPEYYGSSFKNPMGWSDVYQLDYTCAEMRLAMIDAMKYWVTEFDIDGFRCDYADGVPVDFWAQAREAVDAVKPLTWLAESAGEGNNVKLVTDVFDYNYAWKFNTDLISAGTGTAVAQKVSDAAYLLYNARDTQKYAGKSRMVYLSNHDVVQDQKGTPDRHFGANLKPMTVFMFTAYGMPLLYNGQEIAYSAGQQMLAEKYAINWNSGDASVTELITALCRLKHSCPVLNAGDTGGDYIRHTCTGPADRVLVYERRKGNQSLVVMLNFSDSEETLTTATLPGGVYKEYFSGDLEDFAKTHRFTLPAKGYAIWTRIDDTPIAEQHFTLYADDATGWDALNAYAWYDGNYAEIKGGWPGSSYSGTTTLSDGVTYKTFDFPATTWGHPYRLIFNKSTAQLSNYTYRLESDARVRITTSGVETLDLLPELVGPDYSAETPWVAGHSGVESITPDADADGPVEYFDLQGRRIAHPTSGLYIRRQGRNVTKILIK